MKSKFLNLKQTSQALECSEDEVKDLVEEGHISSYKIAGEFIRFKEDDVLKLKRRLNNQDDDGLYAYSFTEKLVDFLYFNDFYILATLIIFLILAIIFLEVF